MVLSLPRHPLSVLYSRRFALVHPLVGRLALVPPPRRCLCGGGWPSAEDAVPVLQPSGCPVL